MDFCGNSSTRTASQRFPRDQSSRGVVRRPADLLVSFPPGKIRDRFDLSPTANARPRPKPRGSRPTLGTAAGLSQVTTDPAAAVFGGLLYLHGDVRPASRSLCHLNLCFSSCLPGYGGGHADTVPMAGWISTYPLLGGPGGSGGGEPRRVSGPRKSLDRETVPSLTRKPSFRVRFRYPRWRLTGTGSVATCLPDDRTRSRRGGEESGSPNLRPPLRALHDVVFHWTRWRV